jgi:hypothetical protein
MYMDPTKLNFHLGALYGIPHYIGAMRELQRNKPDGELHYYGNSAGGACALVCYLMLNGYITIDQIQSGAYKVLDNVGTITVTLTPIYCNLIDVMVPYWPADLAERVSGILYIGVSTKTQHKFVNQFKTNADLYNALMCSGTIVGLSNYPSIIDDEVCLDGAYRIDETMVPKNATVITSDIRPPLALTCPPRFLYPWLEENGRRNVIYGHRYPLFFHEINTKCVRTMFLMHECVAKDPQWEQHIEEITKSKISRLQSSLVIKNNLI